jgi:hypothetical protein
MIVAQNATMYAWMMSNIVAKISQGPVRLSRAKIKPLPYLKDMVL